ncbi:MULTISPECIES: hypothetical protein [Pseudocitrobacter]|uniref:DUF4190 domain-containing protein n=1 Tax=Pseudocitrobacter vendiensis TaxID=2488306 RepID=A0ABM9F740_9ENTR|nr:MULTISPECIES: hypothetical protein [Pseudocitrobacter]KAA1048282.1 hypothetical protein F0Q32_14655 [Pseudocitrobacter sp. 73]CAH6636348.1 hypothetical protein FBBNIHIM_05895 [Pseudocitrobacter vendiensis]
MSKDSSTNVTLKRIKPSSIYRLMLIGLGIPLQIFAVVCGVMGIFGADMVKWNNQPVHGILALPAAIFSALFVTVLFTAFLGSVACLGLWIYSRFRPLEVKTLD